MKLYVSEDSQKIKETLHDFELTNYEEAEDILIVPGGIGSLHDMFRGIMDKKNIYLYNKKFYYTPVLKVLFRMYEDKTENRVPSEYMDIESDFDVILQKLEEKKNGKANDGKTSKLL